MKETKEKLLFVCDNNMVRSPTAENIINTDEKYSSKYTAKSAGVYRGDMYGNIINGRVLKFLTEDMLLWTNMVFVFCQDHITEIGRRFPGYKSENIVNLEIRDIYQDYMDAKLVALIKERIDVYLK